MAEHYDALETRDPAQREQALFASLPGFIARAIATAPGWARHLAGIEPEAITSREALGQLPVLRKAALPELQRQCPPLGGLTTTPPAGLARLFMSPGPIFDAEGHGRDRWRVARALFAAGIRKGDIVHNAFAYHLTPAGHMLESGAMALGCPVIPAGSGNTEAQVEAIAHFRPRGYAGTPDFLAALLAKADELGRDVSSLNRGFVSGAALPPSLRAHLQDRGVAVLQAFGTADLGIVAYETEALAGLVVSEEMLVEIVRPGTGDTVTEGEVGELVVTSLNADYPLIRFATGDLSAILRGTSPCGRTNTRLEGWLGRADQRTKVKGMFVDPAQVAAIGRRHPELGRLRLVVTRDDDEDVMTLRAESRSPEASLPEAVARTLRTVTRLEGEVELRPMGSLPNDGKVIADERRYD